MKTSCKILLTLSFSRGLSLVSPVGNGNQIAVSSCSAALSGASHGRGWRCRGQHTPPFPTQGTGVRRGEGEFCTGMAVVWVRKRTCLWKPAFYCAWINQKSSNVGIFIFFLVHTTKGNTRDFITFSSDINKLFGEKKKLERIELFFLPCSNEKY